MEIRARIYTPTEHSISPKLINSYVTIIATRLRRHRYRAYVVGGAVRDLLSGIVPKDFDMVTNATPQQIRSIFENSNIIGRRFRLVHLYFRPQQIIELATFRATSTGNQYGYIEEDALRRDFSANALYYDPLRQWVIDYVGGVRDIQRHRLRPIIPLSYIFKEDAVRMVRAVKYSVLSNLRISPTVRHAIIQQAQLLQECSRSRLTDEIEKILLSGCAAAILQQLHRYRLLATLQPMAVAELRQPATRNPFLLMLNELDHIMKRRRNLRVALVHYLRIPLTRHSPITQQEALRVAKRFLAPATPPNAIVESAVRHLRNGKSVRRRRR